MIYLSLLASPHGLLALLFVLTVAHLVTLKLCSDALDPRTAPVFVGVWTLLGGLAVYPRFAPLLEQGAAIFAQHPLYLVLALLKGVVLCALMLFSQVLMRESLSSRHYVTPMSVGLIAVVNAFLGEALPWQSWVSALGLCAVSAAFFFRGHLADLSPSGRRSYLLLVFLSVFISAIDHAVTAHVNWYTLYMTAGAVLAGVSIVLSTRRKGVLKAALFSPLAILAGVAYAATELVKFYQMVTINPVSVIVMTQAITKPVILLLSAWIWKERTVKEQLAWGLAAFALVMLPQAF